LCFCKTFARHSTGRRTVIIGVSRLASIFCTASISSRSSAADRRADDALIAEMQRFARGEAFDERPMPGLNSEAIDFRAASEFFAGVRRLGKKDLDTLHLVTEHQGRHVPTTGGILLFGPDRLRHFPDAWIQVGRFGGTDRARIADHAELKGSLLEAIEQAIAFVEKHSTRGVRIGRLRRSDHWSLPPVAVREAVINAVAHTDYSQAGAPIRIALFDDRLEVENPGLLPFGLTVADLPLGVSKLRNRVIGRVLHELGSGGAVGQRRPAHDCGVPRCRARSPGAGGNRHPVPRDPAHGPGAVGHAQRNRPGYRGPGPGTRRTRDARDRRQDRTHVTRHTHTPGRSCCPRKYHLRMPDHNYHIVSPKLTMIFGPGA